MPDEQDKPEQKQNLEGKLSGLPIYRRGEGYITGTKYQIGDNDEMTETVTAIDREGHEHQISEAKVSRGREKHILEMHREHLKMVEKHQKAVDEQLEELARRKEDLAKQKEMTESDIKVLEKRAEKNKGAEEKAEPEKKE